MKSVLLPVDGSPCALRAVELILAKRARYSRPEELAIHLVNVQLPFTVEDIRWASKEQLHEYYRSLSERDTKSAREMLDRAGVPYTCHELIGDAAEEIVALATELHNDQIVMGTHGRGALQGLLMGSTTTQVIHLAKVPVLLVK